MAGQLQITGKIVGGAKQGAFFTQLDWVQQQCLDKLGFVPWPGTLNLEIPMDHVAVIEEMKVTKGLELVSPDSYYCSGHVFPVSIERLPRMHAKNVIEIISPEMLKESLGVKDGDKVTITINRH
jgi:CTP-dependent riboflavin kinase